MWLQDLLKSRPTCLFEVKVATVHQRSKTERIPGQQQTPTAPLTEHTKEVRWWGRQLLTNEFRSQTLLGLVWCPALLTQWAAAVSPVPSFLRKSSRLARWDKAMTMEVSNLLSKAAPATLRMARTRSVTDRSVRRLGEWLLMCESESASWTTTKRSMLSELPWIMTWVANGCLRSPLCRGPSTASLPSQYSWVQILPTSRAATGNATGRLQDQLWWEGLDWNRPELQFLAWTIKAMSPGMHLSLSSCSRNRGLISTGCLRIHMHIWITRWHHVHLHHTTLVIQLRDIFTPLVDSATALMITRPVRCDILKWVMGWGISRECGPRVLKDTWTVLWSHLLLWGFHGRWATCRSQSTASLCAQIYCNRFRFYCEPRESDSSNRLSEMKLLGAEPAYWTLWTAGGNVLWANISKGLI